MRIITIPKCSPTLGNQPPSKVVTVANGKLEVSWIDQIDAHGLFLTFADGQIMLLATHNNGHSCLVLAERIETGNEERVIAQADFIRRCGGTCASDTALLYANAIAKAKEGK